MDYVLKDIQSLSEDSSSGAAEVAFKASQLLERAFEEISLADPENYLKALREVGIKIINAQPSMAPLFNLVNEIFMALEECGSIPQMKERAIGAIYRWRELLLEGSLKIARFSLDFIGQGSTIATYSWSSTVINALSFAREMGRDFRVILSEGRPGMEGKRAAKVLSEKGIPVLLVIDAAIPGLLRNVEIVLVGADAVTTKGIWNKVGTLPLTLAAKEFKRPFYILCGTDKFLAPGREGSLRVEEKDPQEILPMPIYGVKVSNIYFESSPLDYITGVITEEGIFKPHELLEKLRRKRISALLANSLLE